MVREKFEVCYLTGGTEGSKLSGSLDAVVFLVLFVSVRDVKPVFSECIIEAR